jgi:hypothetical protein
MCLCRLLAVDNGGIDWVDRCPNHPVWLDAGLMKRLADTALIDLREQHPPARQALFDYCGKVGIHGADRKTLRFHVVLLQFVDSAGAMISDIRANCRSRLCRSGHWHDVKPLCLLPWHLPIPNNDGESIFAPHDNAYRSSH